MYRTSVVIALILAFAVAQGDELPLPRKLDNDGPIVPPVQAEAPRDDGNRALNDLRNQVQQLQAAREALKTDADAARPPANADKPTNAEEISRLKKRLAEAVLKLEAAEKKKAAAAPAAVKPTPPPTPPASPSVISSVPSKAPDPPAQPFVGAAMDALALGPVLFQAGDYEGALTAYRLVKAEEVPPADRVAVMYMTAACLRKLGKMEEAATLFREVANAKGEDVLVECAQWQLSAIRWKHDVESTLEEFRQRRKALEAKP